MESDARFSRAGGCLLALAILVGTFVGIIFREPSLGFMIGAGAGFVLLVAVWLFERLRSKRHPGEGRDP